VLDRETVRIHKNHLYHGAALLQIAEDPHFKAINSIITRNGPSRSAYEILGQSKHRSAVYLKYATSPTDAYDEYVFNFNTINLSELEEIAEVVPKVFIALVCVQAEQICCLPYRELLELIKRRKELKGGNEETYTILVTAPENKSLRVYMNVPGVKKKQFGEITISRNDFPSAIFE
jgi:hypothetical protein